MPVLKRPSPALVLAGAALIVALGGVAIGAPGDGGVINGCYSNDRGVLRVVDAGTACESNETALTWNQQGPSGGAGPQGPPGDPRLLDGPAPTDEPARSPALSAPVKKPKAKIKIKKPKPKLKIDPNAPPGLLFQYSNRVFDGPQDDSFVYVKPGVTKTVARLELPQGRFFVTAEATVDPTGPESVNAIYSGHLQCELHTTQQGLVAADRVTGRGRKNFTMQAAAFHKKKGAVELRCENGSPASGTSLWDITISAISVSSAYLKWE